MYTQCPQCNALLKLTTANLTQIKASKGEVRCKQCQHVFKAKDHLVREIARQAAIQATAPAAHSHTDDLPEELRHDILHRSSHSLTSLILWFIIALLLAGGLYAQYLWLTQRDQLLQNPETRIWLVRFCENFVCQLPPTRDTNRFRMIKHDARLHPTQPNALQFNAEFINDAPFPQIYPDLQLVFEDASGQVVAQRRFTPVEYLQKMDLSPNDLPTEMPSGASVHIRLDVLDMAGVVEQGKIMQGYHFTFW